MTTRIHLPPIPPPTSLYLLLPKVLTCTLFAERRPTDPDNCHEAPENGTFYHASPIHADRREPQPPPTPFTIPEQVYYPVEEDNIILVRPHPTRCYSHATTVPEK